MQDEKSKRLHQLLRAKHEARFEKLWNSTNSGYTRTREIAEFIHRHGCDHGELLALPCTELSDLVKLLSREFYLGRKSEQIGKGETLIESYIAEHGHDPFHFYSWCAESGVISDGQLLGLLLDVWGVLKDRRGSV